MLENNQNTVRSVRDLRDQLIKWFLKISLPSVIIFLAGRDFDIAVLKTLLKISLAVAGGKGLEGGLWSHSPGLDFNVTSSEKCSLIALT